MPPSILSSSLLSIPVLDTLLRNPTLTPEDRIPLLHAKITFLTNGPTSSTHTVAAASSTTESTEVMSARSEEREKLVEELETRIQVAKLFLQLKPVKWVEAENELTMVEGRCKPFFKKPRRRDQVGGVDEGSAVDEELLRTLRAVRVDALKELVKVEEGLGRDGRAKRWKELVINLEKA